MDILTILRSGGVARHRRRGIQFPRTAAIRRNAMAAIYGRRPLEQQRIRAERRRMMWIDLRSQMLLMNALRSRLDMALGELDALEYMPVHTEGEKERLIHKKKEEIRALREENILSLENLHI